METFEFSVSRFTWGDAWGSRGANIWRRWPASAKWDPAEPPSGFVAEPAADPGH